jgi:hypothetical protein
MKKLSTLFLFALGIAAAVPPALAQDGHPAKKHAAKKGSAKKAAASENAGNDGDDKAPDIAGYTALEYDCELGNKISIYRQAEDNEHIALRWKKQLLQLTRVTTTTGANRFENKKSGLVWIDIPAKGMLLDSKKGQQLANECKHPEQIKTTAEAAKS